MPRKGQEVSKHNHIPHTPAIWECAKNVSGDLAIYSGDRDLLNDESIPLKERVANLTLMQLAPSMADAVRQADEGDLSMIRMVCALLDHVHECNEVHFMAPKDID